MARPSRKTVPSAIAILGVVATMSVVPGCARPPSAPPLGVAAPEAAPAPIEAMTPDVKRSTIATSFPIEVPVPVGRFTRANAQGDEAWDYTVHVSASPDAVAAWYRDAYASRQWELVADSEFGGTDRGRTGRVLEFRKGNAGSEVAVDAAQDADGTTTTRVILGVGVEVLQTQ